MREKELDSLIEEFNQLHLAQARVLKRITDIRNEEKERAEERRRKNLRKVSQAGNSRLPKQSEATASKPSKKSSWYHCHTNRKFKKGDRVYITSKVTVVGNDDGDRKATVTGQYRSYDGLRIKIITDNDLPTHRLRHNLHELVEASDTE